MTPEWKVREDKRKELKKHYSSNFSEIAKQEIFGRRSTHGYRSKQAKNPSRKNWERGPWYSTRNWFLNPAYVGKDYLSMRTIPAMHESRIACYNVVNGFTKEATERQTREQLQASIAFLAQLKQALALALPGKERFDESQTAVNQFNAGDVNAPIWQTFYACFEQLKQAKLAMTAKQKAVLAVYEKSHLASLVAELYDFVDVCEANLKYFADTTGLVTVQSSLQGSYHQYRSQMHSAHNFVRSIPENVAWTSSFAVVAALLGILVVFVVATASTAGVMGPTAAQAMGSAFVTFLPLLLPAITAAGAALAALLIALHERANRQTVKECEDKIKTLLDSPAPGGNAGEPAVAVPADPVLTAAN